MDLTYAADECLSSDTSLTLGSSSSPGSVKIWTLLLFLLGFQDQASAVITNVSVIQSWRWFFHLSAFESVFLAFIIAQIGALSILGILPINLTELWQGMAAGRRKKRQTPSTTLPPHVAQATKDIGMKLLKLYKRLDQNECGFRALCELQSKVTLRDYNMQQLPRATQLVLTTFRSFAEQPSSFEESGNEEKEGTNSVDTFSAVQPYVEAIKIGFQSEPEAFNADLFYGNATNTEARKYENACHRKYPTCPVTSDELMEYIERINVLHY